MMKRTKVLWLMIICLFLASCSKNNTPILKHSFIDYSEHTNSSESSYQTILADLSQLNQGQPVIAHHEQITNPKGMKTQGLNMKIEGWGYDVRNQDLSHENLDMIKNFSQLAFNTNTLWPESLPIGFDPQHILEQNKNPGLGIRALHEEGYTGKEIGIAIIDQALLLEHEQYKDNLVFYERIHCSDNSASMHGPGVASIAVGKDIGVAPDAKLYFIASTFGHFNQNEFEFDASIIADSILRILEINEQLPLNDKIRVISISRGYGENDLGYKEITEAIEKANAENIFVITTSTSAFYDFDLFGLGRDYQADPDDFNAYQPAEWISDKFYDNPSRFQASLLVPMGSRTYAGWTGASDYEINAGGGLSWAVPWLAGFYALCCEVEPSLTPQQFIDVIMSTSITATTTKDNYSYPLGKIIDPSAAIDKLLASK